MLTACSSFNPDWKSLDHQSSLSGIEGRWTGIWKSDRNQHTGRLRCILTRQTDARYLARFEAKFWKLFTAHYAVPLSVRPRGDEWEFFGTENLGWYAGGRYNYEGVVNKTNFFSTYRCKWDHGVFRMSRP